MTTQETCLKGISLSKQFNGTAAISNVDFSLNAGEIHSVIGNKGAGKTILMRILSGSTAVDSGYIELNGRRIRKHSPAIARENGLQSLYESQYLMQDMTVAENIFMGEYMSSGGAFANLKKQKRMSREILARLGSDIDPDNTPNNLTDFDCQLVQMARIYANNAHIVLADEITGSQSDEHRERILQILSGMADDGISIVYFTHKIEDAIKISNRITVLREGRRICVRERKAFNMQSLIQDMLGCDESLTKCLDITQDEDKSSLFMQLTKAAEKNENILDYLKAATAYINEHLDAPLSPQLVADKIHLSSGYLMMLFKTHLNTTIMEYTYKRRIEQSKLLLENRNVKISDIAADVGIPNSQYFSVLFKKHTGMTPIEYRRTHF